MVVKVKVIQIKERCFTDFHLRNDQVDLKGFQTKYLSQSDTCQLESA